jgi:hypothetical protein
MTVLPRQSINLYRPSTSRWGGAFRLATIGWSMLIVIVGLGVLSFHAWRGLRQSEQQASQVVAQARVRTSSLAALGEQFAASGQLDALRRQVDELQRTASGLQLVLERLGSAEFGRQQGFSSAIAALARARIDGVWIERLSISGVDGTLDLRGTAAEAELLPDYLGSLGRQAALQRRGISDLVIETPAEAGSGRGTVNFHISQAGDGAAQL